MKSNVYLDINPGNVLRGDPSNYYGFRCFSRGVLGDLEGYYRLGKEQIVGSGNGTLGWRPPGKILQYKKSNR
jgi:hypothetical protein